MLGNRCDTNTHLSFNIPLKSPKMAEVLKH